MSLRCVKRYFLNRFHLYLLLFACSSSKPVVNICPPISPRLVCIVSPHHTNRRGSNIHLGIANTVFAGMARALVQNMHSFQLKEIRQVRWVKQTFFPLRRKSNASVYKTLCVWLLWIEMYLFLYFALCQGLKFP